MRKLLVVLALLGSAAAPAQAQVSVGIGIGMPGLNIGIDLPVYPQLERVPGYPVYYAPQLSANYFFYDNRYWVYEQDSWFASSWYNGPWGRVDAQAVPAYVLRVPVRYYRAPPGYFRGWRTDAPPRWGEHWGPEWQQRRNGWDRWNPRAAPPPAPLPAYQRKYPNSRYPQPEQQQPIQRSNGHPAPRDVPRQAAPARPPAERGRSEQHRRDAPHGRPSGPPGGVGAF